MESPEQNPETLSAEQASDELDQDRDRNLHDTSETEMTGSAEPGTTATPEGTSEVDEELEDRGDV
jgi:hypothetical protein